MSARSPLGGVRRRILVIRVERWSLGNCDRRLLCNDGLHLNGGPNYYAPKIISNLTQLELGS